MDEAEEIKVIVRNGFIAGYIKCCTINNLDIIKEELINAVYEFLEDNPLLKTEKKDIDEYLNMVIK